MKQTFEEAYIEIASATLNKFLCEARMYNDDSQHLTYDGLQTRLSEMQSAIDHINSFLILLVKMGYTTAPGTLLGRSLDAIIAMSVTLQITKDNKQLMKPFKRYYGK